MKEIDLIEARAGSWDEYHTWPVVAFEDKSKAEKYAELASEWAKAPFDEYCGEGPAAYGDQEYTSPYDPNFHQTYDYPTEYIVVTVPVRWNIPTAVEGM